MQHFQRGNALVSKLISSIYKNSICTQLFENITKVEKNHLRAKYRASYASFRLQRTILLFFCDLCEPCVLAGKTLGTHLLGAEAPREAQLREQASLDVFYRSRPFDTSFASTAPPNVG